MVLPEVLLRFFQILVSYTHHADQLPRCHPFAYNILRALSIGESLSVKR